MFKLSPPKKYHVGGNFLRPKGTAKSSRGTFEHIRPIYRIGSGKKRAKKIFREIGKILRKKFKKSEI